MTNSPDEWYSPLILVECARSAMGSITLDPFSSDAANSYVRADHYYTLETDGLKSKWFGNIYLNPPFSLRKTDEILARLLKESGSKQIEQAFTILPQHYTSEYLSIFKAESNVYKRIASPVKFLNNDLNTYNEYIDIYYFGGRTSKAFEAIKMLEAPAIF